MPPWLAPATPCHRALARQGPNHEGLSNIRRANTIQVSPLPLTSPSEILIRKLRRISELRESDLAVLRSIAIQEKEVPASHDLVLEGDRPSHSFVLIDGLVGSTALTSGCMPWTGPTSSLREFRHHLHRKNHEVS
jgi:CRP-like cAMP-binding protein